MSPLEHAALIELYASLGFTTIPVQARGKRPLRKGWLAGDPAAWIGAPPDANVGILCGSASGGLVVLDFDEQDGPHEVLGLSPRELAAHTLVAQTARGWHVYTKHAGALSRSPRRGLDVRGDGSMVVAPPSVHPTGSEYRFVGEARRVADAAWLGADDLFNKKVDTATVRWPAAPEPARRATAPVDWDAVEEWIGAQAPKLRDAWAGLKRMEAPDAFDRSRADFAVARCLWEGGWSVEDVAAVLLSLPGSKSQERGETYTRRTAARAANLSKRVVQP